MLKPTIYIQHDTKNVILYIVHSTYGNFYNSSTINDYKHNMSQFNKDTNKMFAPSESDINKIDVRTISNHEGRE